MRRKNYCALRRAMLEAFERRLLFSGYTASTIASFDGTGGSSPTAPLIMDNQGNLFGTTSGGGTSGLGTVFEIANGSTTPVTIASFSNSSTPEGALAFDTQSNLWGTSSAGGANGLGTVFEIAKGSNSINDVASFNSATGGNPFAGLTSDGNGNLFGTTTNYGAHGLGTVFEIAKGTTTIKLVDSFNGANGASPSGPVIFDSNANLFGTASGGGDASGDGTFFEIPVGTTAIKLVAAFNGTNGSAPQGTLAIDAGGNFFGTTAAGGDANGDGTVFEITKGAHAITHIASFNGADGSGALSGLISDKNGDFFGTTAGGTGLSSNGTVFEIPKGITAIKTIGTFNGINGAGPQAGVTIDAGNNLFGGTAIGGASGNGTIFEVPVGSTLKALASFTGRQGIAARGSVAFDKNGDIFGTTSQGGLFGDGTVYSIESGTSTITTLGTFNGTNGSSPEGDIVIDSNGNLFGTTPSGGANSDGTLYEIAKGTNTIKTLVNFNGTNGGSPLGGLTIDASGNIFGTTLTGGVGGGVIYEIPHGTNTMKVLASFNISLLSNPYCNLAVDSQDNIFGAANQGHGSATDGAVFELPNGSNQIQVLATFNGSNGSLPMGDVAVDASGNFFGATISGGSAGSGVVYEVVKGSKTVTDLVSFNSANGSAPFGGITLDASGNVFGTAQSSSGGPGEVFEIAKGTKTAQILTTFNGVDGASPLDTVKFDANGNLYGTTFDGGLHGGGNVFKLTPTITLTAPAAQSTVAGVTEFFALGSFLAPNAVGPFTATINWGDGTPPQQFFTSTTGAFTSPFTFTKATVDVVTVSVADSKGHVSNVIKFNITVTPDTFDPASLAIVQQPTTAVAGAALNPAITVDVEDRFGNLETTDSSNVSLTLSASPTGGALVGATTVKAVKGVATFSGLLMKVAGSYTVKAVDGKFNSAVSKSIAFAAAAANKLVIAQQPAGGKNGVALSPAFIIDVEDSFGNIVTTDASPVTISLASAPAGATLSGILTVNAVKGVATFGSMKLSKAGTYVFKLVDGKMGAVLSKSIVES